VRRIIGLTGGIGTGKSTVSDYLADRYHLPILDADLYAREAVAIGSEALDLIADRYGAEILLSDGSLDRSRLGGIVFAQPAERQWLESIVHPLVRGYFERDLAACDGTVVAVIPLLFEAGLQAWVTEIWVVACAEAQQLERVQGRDGLTVDLARQRLASQLPLATKISQADWVLDNSGSWEFLRRQVDLAMNSSRFGVDRAEKPGSGGMPPQTPQY
jgi:dephospho-CoA kinase